MAQVPPNYDSLLGKLIVWGEDRTQAINRMQRALNEIIISGVTTTIQYHTMLLDLQDFKDGNVDTGFIPNHADELKEPPPAKPVRLLMPVTLPLLALICGVAAVYIWVKLTATCWHSSCLVHVHTRMLCTGWSP